MAATGCPEEAELSRFVTRVLPVGTAASVESHLGDCDDCRNLVFALASALEQHGIDVIYADQFQQYKDYLNSIGIASQ